MSTSLALTSSEFLSCTLRTPTTTTTATVTTTFTETYLYTAVAACPTSEWTVTYTIIEICTGNPDEFTPPVVPPNFVRTTVTCDVCSTPTQVITCPVAEADRTGAVVIIGSGVKAGPGAMPVETGMPMGTATMSAHMPYVTAGAPRSLKKSLGLLAGAALIAGQFLL